MQFYISAMFVGFPDEIHEEKPSFLDFENNWLRTDRPSDRPNDGWTDGRTDPLIEMRGHIQNQFLLKPEVAQFERHFPALGVFLKYLYDKISLNLACMQISLRVSIHA